MNLFFQTLQVVGGILTPVVVILVLKFIFDITIESMVDRRQKLEYKTEKYKKTVPFDDRAEFYKVPNPTMIGVRLFKDDIVVWEGAIDREGHSI